MGVDRKIAEALSIKHPEVITRGAEKLPLQRGDRVADAAYVHLPMRLPEGYGHIVKISGYGATVQWDDGTSSVSPIRALVRVAREFLATPHDSAYEIPAFKADDRVVLGNGNRGVVIAEVTGPTGFKSYSVKVTHSADNGQVGRRIFATTNGMIKVSGLAPDAIVSIIDPVKGAIAVVGCDLAVTPHDKAVGLQKYSSLPTDHGLLFPFDPPQPVQFHMGNVAFPIDVLFITEHGTIQKVEANCEPGYDERWKSMGRVSAVLEVNGGFCAARGISPGMRVRVGVPKAAQETYDPTRTDVHNYQSPGAATHTTNRYKDRQTPDQVLQDSQPLDGEHYDIQLGYDPISYLDDPDAPGTRPG